MKSKKICIIINPYSQGGRTKINYPEYINNLKNNGLEFDMYHTKAEKHSTDIVKKYFDDYDTFIAIGGDGLLHEMAQVLVNCKEKKLGIIPSGNGNMLASHHWIYNIQDAVDSIKKNKIDKIDLVKITFKTDKGEKTVYSHCIFGIGYISDVVRLAVNNFRLLGPKLCYPLSGIFGALYSNINETNIKIDNKKQMIKRLNTIIFLNHGRIGPFKIIGNSSDTDGKIDYVVYENMGRIGSLMHVAEAAFKKNVFTKNKTIGQAKKIKIETSSEKELMIDGEMYGNITGFKAEVIPKCLNILSNKSESKKAGVNK